MKKKLVLGMAGVMAFTTLLGTNVVIGNADEDKVEITYTSRGNADEIKVYQQAVDAFNEAQDKICLLYTSSIPWEAAWGSISGRRSLIISQAP